MLQCCKYGQVSALTVHACVASMNAHRFGNNIQTDNKTLFYVDACECTAGGYAGVRADGLHIDSHTDCIRAPGLRHVLCSSWGDDNLGEGQAPPAWHGTVMAQHSTAPSRHSTFHSSSSLKFILTLLGSWRVHRAFDVSTVFTFQAFICLPLCTNLHRISLHSRID